MSKTSVQTESAIHKLKGSQNQGGHIANNNIAFFRKQVGVG